MVVGSSATHSTNATAHGSIRTHRREAPASSPRGRSSSTEVMVTRLGARRSRAVPLESQAGVIPR